MKNTNGTNACFILPWPVSKLMPDLWWWCWWWCTRMSSLILWAISDKRRRLTGADFSLNQPKPAELKFKSGIQSQTNIWCCASEAQPDVASLSRTYSNLMRNNVCVFGNHFSQTVESLCSGSRLCISCRSICWMRSWTEASTAGVKTVLHVYIQYIRPD